MSLFNMLQSTFMPRNTPVVSDSEADSESQHLDHMDNPYKVEVVTIKDYKKAAKTLQIAFKEDLYVNYLTSAIKDVNLKQQMDLAIFEASTYSTILSGLVLAVRDLQAELTDPNAPFLAVAVFEKPGEEDDEPPNNTLSYLWSMYQSGYMKFLWKANKETRQRVFVEQHDLLNKYREDVLGEQILNAFYLGDIGAIPKGRGKGLARRLIEFACHNYIDVYNEEEDSDDENDTHGKSGGAASNLFSKKEDSLLDSEIQSFNFAFDLDNDNVTDYSGYSSFSDSDVSSAHSSYYYKEDDDILAQYDNLKNHGKKTGALIYLESSHPRNRKIYQKLGFSYVKTVEVAEVLNKDGLLKKLTVDLMVRGIKGAKWFKTEDGRPI